MQMKDRTKIMFADTLEEMLRTVPMEKIRVSRLCERCGTTTPTFYYYFHDKYELVAWMFLQDFSYAVGDKEPEYSEEVLNNVARQLEKRRAFYQKAFTDSSQNSISEYTQEFNIQIAADAVKYHTGAELTKEELFAVKYHVYGVMGMFREWLFDGNMSVEELNARCFERTPDFLKEAFAVYPYRTDAILQRSGKQTKKDNDWLK